MSFRSIVSMILVLASSHAVMAGCMDTDNQFWRGSDPDGNYGKLMQIMACPADADRDTGHQVDAVACNYFVAKGLQELYSVSDFIPSSNNGRWLTANEIANYVRTHSDRWTLLGNADKQQVLSDAAAGAAQRQPTIAVMKGDPHGHVAIILPGALHRSGNWKLNVPNSAAFSLDNVNKAYVFCRLSFAFSDPAQVEIYFRLKQ